MPALIKREETVRVLLVENYGIARAGLREVLSSYRNIEITGEAETAVQAFSLAEKLRPDVLLMDILGQEACCRNSLIKIKEKFKDIRIIILTAHESSKEVIACLSAGANAYCCKDITPEMLALVIRSVAKGACWVDPAASETALNMFKKSKYSPNVNFNLTAREREVLAHMVNGESNVEIAKKLIVSVHTAKAHVCNVMQKMGVDDRVKAAVLAVKANLV